MLDAEIAALRSGVGDQVVAQAPIALALQTTALLGMLPWRAGEMMLVVKGSWLPGLQARPFATGRMALAHYITRSLLFSLVFHGHGLGLFERVGAAGQVAIMAVIWVLELTWSTWWLARFRFGSLEWSWRSVASMRWQPHDPLDIRFVAGHRPYKSPLKTGPGRSAKPSGGNAAPKYS